MKELNIKPWIPPFKVLDVCTIKIVDSEGHQAIDCLVDCSEALAGALNGVPLAIGRKELMVEGVTLYLKRKPLLRVRGWGWLTGTGGLRLTEEEAIDAQSRLMEYIIYKLTGDNGESSKS